MASVLVIEDDERTGLGLDIASSLARVAGGELRLERSPLGGARVILDLPAARDAA